MTKSKILVVEDEKGVREVICDVLGDEGFEIVEAATGDIAFGLLEQVSPHLLLTDINMPGQLDGIELAERARASRFDLPVVFITGKPEGALRADKFKGPKSILKKPFALDKLITSVHQLMLEAKLNGHRPVEQETRFVFANGPEVTRHGVLIVEDEPIFAEMLSAMIGSMGIPICGRATCADDAVRLAQMFAPELVLMDVRLAGKRDGVDAALAIRRFAMMPIIYITGSRETTNIERIKTDHPAAVLFKPFQYEQLKKVVQHAIA